MEASLIMYGGTYRDSTYAVNIYRVRIYHMLSAVDNKIIIKLQTSYTSDC